MRVAPGLTLSPFLRPNSFAAGRDDLLPGLDSHIHGIHRNLSVGEKVGCLLEFGRVVAAIRVWIIEIRAGDFHGKGTRKPEQILPPGDYREVSRQLLESVNRDRHPRIGVSHLLFGLHRLQSAKQACPTAHRAFLCQLLQLASTACSVPAAACCQRAVCGAPFLPLTAARSRFSSGVKPWIIRRCKARFELKVQSANCESGFFLRKLMSWSRACSWSAEGYSPGPAK